MPSLTITSVDDATDQWTLVGHGLLTGDGPAVVRNTGGALPIGVAPVTDYWIICVDADTFKLAASSSDAMTGTAIDVTSPGTGTQILEIGIPYCRSRTYVPKSANVAGSQLKSADLNSMMDSLKALHRLLTAQAQDVWSIVSLEAPALYYTEPVPILIPGARAVDGAGVHAALNSASGCRIGTTLAADTAPLTYPIDGLHPGDVITAWSVAINKASGGTGAYQGWIKSLHATTYAEANESAGTGVQNGGGPVSGWSIGETALNVSVAQGKQYYLDVDPNGGCSGDAVYSAIVWVSRPRS